MGKFLTRTVNTSEGNITVSNYQSRSITPRTNREIADAVVFKLIHRHFRKKGYGSVGGLKNHSLTKGNIFNGLTEVVGKDVTTYHGEMFRLSGSVYEDKEAGTVLHDECGFHIIIKNKSVETTKGKKTC